MDSPLPEGSTALLWGLYLAILRSSSHAHTRDILSCRVSAIVALKQRQISRGRRGLTQGLVVRLVALCARRHSRGRPRRQPPEGSCVLVEPGEDQPCIRCPFMRPVHVGGPSRAILASPKPSGLHQFIFRARMAVVFIRIPPAHRVPHPRQPY